MWEKQRDWNRLERAAQNASAKGALNLCCGVLGLQTDAELVDVKDNDRIVLSYVQSADHPDFARSMIKLETLMRHVMGVAIDLRLESKEDKNKRAGRNGRE